MLLLRLTCCCFLVLFVESRGIAKEPVTWLQVHDKGVTVPQLENYNEIRISENMGNGLVAVARLNQNDMLGCLSEGHAEEGNIKEAAAVEKNIEESVDVKVRSKVDREAETEANAQLKEENGTWVKPKWQPFVGKETISETDRTWRYKVRRIATDTKPGVKEIAWPILKATLDGATKDEGIVKIQSELSPEVEVGVRYILKSEPKAKEIQKKAQPIVVQALETRGFSESFPKPFKHRTSGLMTPGGVLDLGKRTIQPYIEWMKTFCRNLPINNNFLLSSFHRLLSLGGGRGGKVGRDARKPKSNRSKIQPVDLGLKTIADGKQIKILSGRNEDGPAVPVTLEDDETFITPPQSPMKIFREPPPTKPFKTSPRISPEPSPKLSPKEFKGSNGKEKKPADSWAITQAREEIDAPIIPPWSPQKSPKESPPRYTKKSPPKKRNGWNGSGVPGEEWDGVLGPGKDTREPITPPESPKESPRKSPVKERGDNGDEEGDQVPRSRFAGFNPMRLQEGTLSFKTRRKEMGLSSDDDDDVDKKKPGLPLRVTSADFQKDQVYFADAWKLVEDRYGRQQA